MSNELDLATRYDGSVYLGRGSDASAPFALSVISDNLLPQRTAEVRLTRSDLFAIIHTAIELLTQNEESACRPTTSDGQSSRNGPVT